MSNFYVTKGGFHSDTLFMKSVEDADGNVSFIFVNTRGQVKKSDSWTLLNVTDWVKSGLVLEFDNEAQMRKYRKEINPDWYEHYMAIYGQDSFQDIEEGKDLVPGCCHMCNDGDGDCIYPYYGLAPHVGQGDNIEQLKKSAWPANFRWDESCGDPDKVIGSGTYEGCLYCGRGGTKVELSKDVLTSSTPAQG